MNNFNSPLYPPNSYPDNEEKKEPKMENSQSPLFSLLSSFGGENMSNILPLLLGMKNGKMENITSLFGSDNPLLQAMSTFSAPKKKESQSSLKDIVEDNLV